MTTNDKPLPGGTRVLNTDDGEPGVIVNGFSYDADAGGWIEYEVETADGIERWMRDRSFEVVPRGKTPDVLISEWIAPYRVQRADAPAAADSQAE